MNTSFEDLLLMIVVGILVGTVTNVIAHYLAVSRDKTRREWEEAQDEDCDDTPPETASTEP